MMRFGIDRLIDDHFAPLHGKRVALFSNLSAVNRDLVTTYDVFRMADAVNLVALFGPEHGFGGAAADGMAVDTATDPRTGLPVYSLYGETFRPTAAMLDGIDLLVCDLQDVGVRYYTFLWTLTHIMEACGEVGVPLLILDRPNPLGGTLDGGALEPKLASLVGRFPIPIQHGMTIGELATLINGRWNPHPAEMTVYACDGWRRDQDWSRIGRAFVPPSPNMPHFVAAQHYPGSCLIEGTTLSEGRGTPLPFEVVGAPYLDGAALADALNGLKLPGVRFRPHLFEPSASKCVGQTCGGVQAHITDPVIYRPVRAWLAVIHTIRHLYPEDFAWLPQYHPAGLQHFDRLIGDRHTRRMIDAGDPVAVIVDGWQAFQAEFKALAAPHLLYG
ncbi:MAG: DUF1343 domain-containing protein [Anaerolineaceae bacterium]|nr:DUF1343 domain-containing protein [Anaerolineaceae bacterium]